MPNWTILIRYLFGCISVLFLDSKRARRCHFHVSKKQKFSSFSRFESAKYVWCNSNCQKFFALQGKSLSGPTSFSFNDGQLKSISRDFIVYREQDCWFIFSQIFALRLDNTAFRDSTLEDSALQNATLENSPFAPWWEVRSFPVVLRWNRKHTDGSKLWTLREITSWTD